MLLLSQWFNKNIRITQSYLKMYQNILNTAGDQELHMICAISDYFTAIVDDLYHSYALY